jgi:hypothetical protein
VTYLSKVIKVQLERRRIQKMVMWRMTLTFPHPRLILMEREKELLVLVAVGQQEMRLRRKMMVRRRKKCLMWRRSTLCHMLTLDLLCSGCLQTLHGG